MTKRKFNPPPPTMSGMDRLTPDELDHLRAQTYPGQAHWGASRRTCRECLFWNEGEAPVYYAETGALHPQTCGKAARLMPWVDTVRVPHFAHACKYFEENPAAPPVERPKKGSGQ